MAGERAALELLRADCERVERVLVAHGRRLGALEEEARALGVEVERVPRAEVDRLAPETSARGVVAIAKPPRLRPLETLIEGALAKPRPLLVALDQVQDPQNLGAVVRSAEFFGVHGVFWARDRAAGLGPAAVRASAGASERLPLGEVTNLARALEACKRAGFWVLGTVSEDGEPLQEVVNRLTEPTVLVLGGEHRGLRRLTRDRCDVLATIGRRGQIASLNVAAAAAVALFALTGCEVGPGAGSNAD